MQLFSNYGTTKQVNILQTILINVENILTDYVPRVIHFWQNKASMINKELPSDFIDSFLSAGYDQKEKTFYRFPAFAQFAKESENLFLDIHKQIQDSNLTIQKLLSLQEKHDLQFGLIYDQKKTQANSISEYLQKKLNPIVQLYVEDAFLGKPEGNIYTKAKALCHLKANDTLVLDASKNGVLAAYLAHMKGIYLDQGAGVSEKTYKYSHRSIHTLSQLEDILIQLNSQQ